jgi:hypothetical protein
VAKDALKYHPGLPCPTLLQPAGGPPLKRPYGCFRDGPPTGQVACGCVLPLWTPHAVRLWSEVIGLLGSNEPIGRKTICPEPVEIELRAWCDRVYTSVALGLVGVEMDLVEFTWI